MASRIISRLLIRLLVPAGSRPRWFHLLGIVGVSILLFAGGLSGAVDLATGEYLLAVAAFGSFGLGILGAILLRKSLAKTIPDKGTVQFLAQGTSSARSFVRLPPSPPEAAPTANPVGNAAPKPTIRSQSSTLPVRNPAAATKPQGLKPTQGLKPAQVLFQRQAAPVPANASVRRQPTAALK